MTNPQIIELQSVEGIAKLTKEFEFGMNFRHLPEGFLFEIHAAAVQYRPAPALAHQG
jgi:hypothetical protein